MKSTIFVFISFFLAGFSACKKGWLDAKPSQSLTIPTTIKDLQALLDNTTVFNIGYRYLSELGTDDYYLIDSIYNARPDVQRNIYTWAPGNIFEGETSGIDGWASYYETIFYANNVIERVGKIDINDQNHADWNNIKGSALFYRAYNYFDLAQLFCKPYSKNDANEDLGIVLRDESDINILPRRATVKETYEKIIGDLKQAAELLPATQAYTTRPSKTAALAMLARTYLTMEEYDSAWHYADVCLQSYSSLIDYSTLSMTATNPMPSPFYNNNEIIFYARRTNSPMLTTNTNGNGRVDTLLYKSYNANDYRKTLFFKTVNGRLAFVGSYGSPNSSTTLFEGLATDEVYLIRAECYARNGNTIAAMNDINTLLVKRWKAPFISLEASNPTEALDKILTERRKELCFRGIRWTDLRRLNKDPQFQKTLKRVINGQVYTLPPNDNRYVYPIPDNEILYSHIPQNLR